jgi:hypothetical protein
MPPRLATWVLDHLGMRYRNESLGGDLFEEYQQGRNRLWYWRQVIAAVVARQPRPLKPKTRLLFLRIFGHILADLGVVLLFSQIAESEHRIRPVDYLMSPANIAVLALLGLTAATGVGLVIWATRQGSRGTHN